MKLTINIYILELSLNMSERGYVGNVINKNESLAITDPLKSHHSEAFCTARVEDFHGAWFLVN